MEYRKSSDLTKRELIAAMAMQGLLGSDWRGWLVDKLVTNGGVDTSRIDAMAKVATACADALLAELGKSDE